MRDNSWTNAAPSKADPKMEAMRKQLEAAKRQLQELGHGGGRCNNNKNNGSNSSGNNKKQTVVVDLEEADKGLFSSHLDKVKALEKELQLVDNAYKECPSSSALQVAKKDVEAALEVSRKVMREAKDLAGQLRRKADRAAKHPARLKKLEDNLRDALQLREDANYQAVQCRLQIMKELAEHAELQEEIKELTNAVSGPPPAAPPPLGPESVQKWLADLRQGFAQQAAAPHALQKQSTCRRRWTTSWDRCSKYFWPSPKRASSLRRQFRRRMRRQLRQRRRLQLSKQKVQQRRWPPQAIRLDNCWQGTVQHRRCTRNSRPPSSSCPANSPPGQLCPLACSGIESLTSRPAGSGLVSQHLQSSSKKTAGQVSGDALKMISQQARRRTEQCRRPRRLLTFWCWFAMLLGLAGAEP